MKLDKNQETIIQAIDAAKEEILKVSHQIHAKPELGYEEFFASGLLADTLAKHGFEVERKFVGIETAFCAQKKSGKGARVVFLAEYDALPGVGHGCGHNIIGTSALTAGLGLGAVIDQLQGEVWVVGTPAEETDGGKVVMVERGAFNQVDAAMMIHPHDDNYYLTESLAMDAIEIEFHGKPAHAATAPWEGKNALDAMILTFNNMNALRQQVQPHARMHGIILEGGQAPNIVPDHTKGRFYVRSKTRKYLDELVEKFKACVQAAALATDTQMQMRNYENSFDDMVNNLCLAERMRDYLMENLDVKPFKRAPDSFGSVDMGNVSHVVPAIHLLVDIANGKALTAHTPEFAQAAITPYADQVLIKAGKALALTGYDLLTDADMLNRARQEFVATLGYQPAKSS